MRFGFFDQLPCADGFSEHQRYKNILAQIDLGDALGFDTVWLDALASEGGRLLVPLTNAEWWGCFVMITRLGSNPDCYRARFAGRVGVIPCIGGRDQAAEERLKVALARGDFTAIRSLRRAPEEPDDTCWLAGEEWWLSTAPVPKPSL